MKNLTLLFITLLSLIGITQMRADDLTICDGQVTNAYVPIYAYYADNSLKCEVIYPASELTDMIGGEIQQLTFYNTYTSSWTSTGVFNVFIKEVDNTATTGYVGSDDATTVYNATVTVTDGKFIVAFSENYTYNGGNLLIGFYQETKGNYCNNNVNFLGVNASENTTVYGRGSTFTSVSSTLSTFLPKVTFSYEKAVEGPGFKVKGFVNDGVLNYGLVDPSSAKQLTLLNPGTEDVVVNITTTGGFTANDASVTIASKGEQVVSIAAPTDLGAVNGTVTFTPAATELEPVTLNLSATVKDPAKMFVDFSDNALPSDWSIAGIGSYTTGSYAAQYTWNFSSGYASYKSSTSGAGYISSYYHSLVSPLVKFDEGEKFIFSVKKDVSYSTYYSYIKVQWTNDGGATWNDVAGSEKDNSFFTTDWQQVELAMPAAAKQIRFIGCGIGIDDIYGGVVSTDPVMSVVEKSYGFGMIDAAMTTQITIKNVGKSPLTGINVVSDNAVFTVSNVPSSIDANSEATFDVELAVTNLGEQSATITVTAPEQDDATIALNGYVMDNTLFLETFDANTLPDGWENSGWTFETGGAVGKYNYNPKYTLTTPALEVEEGEKMALEVMKTGTTTNSLPIYVSKNGGDFTLYQTIANDALEYNEYRLFYIEGLEAGKYKIRFQGDGTKINAVNGFHLDMNAPQMKVTPTTEAAFGKVTESKTLTYTVANVGTGTLVVDITSDNDAFTVNPTQLTITDTEETFDITYSYNIEDLGNKYAVIKVTPTYNEDVAVTINATAKAIDPSLWDEDFEEQAVPLYWENSKWNVRSGSEYTVNKTYKAYATAKGAQLITPRLQATEGQTLTWEAYHRYYDEAMKVEYSDDDMATWTELYNYRPEDEGITDNYYKKDMEFTAPADGYYYLRFTSGWADDALDNFNGMKVAPKDHDVVITAYNIPETGKQYRLYQTTVTVKEKVNKTEELTAKFFIGDTQYGTDVTETVDALGTKIFYVSFTPEEAIEGEAYFTISNEDVALETDHIDVTFTAAPVLDETVAIESMPSGNQDVIVFKYTPKAGWNTLCVPFQILDADIKAIFGDDCKYYEFKNVTNGVMNFAVPTRTYAGYPLVVYSANPNINAEGYKITGVNVTKTVPDYDGNDNGKFRGTFDPIAAPDMEGKYGVVPSTGRIQKGSATSSLKGWRGYFELPEGTDAASFVMDFGDGTVITAIEAIEAGLLNANGAIYDLNGRKIENTNNLPAGVYIQNGKKLVVK